MRNRLLLIVVGMVALVLVVQDVPLSWHLKDVERDRLVSALERDAFVIAGRAGEALEAGTVGDEPQIDAMVTRYAAEEDVIVVIVDSEAIAVARSDGGVLEEDFSNRSEIETALTGNPTVGKRDSRTLGEELFYVAVPVLTGERVVGAVRLSAPERIVSDRAAGRVRGLLLVASISLATAMAIAWFFSNTVTAPLKRLRSTTDAFATGDLSSRADDSAGPPEVRALAGSFNSMADRIEVLVDRQREFAGTASHQLRTPLTALRLRLEQLAQQIDPETDGVRVLDAALTETDRLHRMIEGLLTLSRAEGSTSELLAVDLGEMVRERAEYWRALAEEHEVLVEVDSPAHVWVQAVGGAGEQIIDNLIDNALEVSPHGSKLVVSVVAGSRDARLHVIDEGPGMSADDRVCAFERFWRGETTDPAGSGLGLAIVHQLAVACGGSAELREAPSGGIDATVVFVAR